MDGKDAVFVQQLVATFTPTERIIIALHYVEALNINEIGLVLDLPAHQVELLLTSLRERTRVALAERDGAVRAPVSALA
jgi:DNA-directed RNA polymerase specialized sigma24 family protein